MTKLTECAICGAKNSFVKYIDNFGKFLKCINCGERGLITWKEEGNNKNAYVS